MLNAGSCSWLMPWLMTLLFLICWDNHVFLKVHALVLGKNPDVSVAWWLPLGSLSMVGGSLPSVEMKLSAGNSMWVHYSRVQWLLDLHQALDHCLVDIDTQLFQICVYIDNTNPGCINSTSQSRLIMVGWWSSEVVIEQIIADDDQWWRRQEDETKNTTIANKISKVNSHFAIILSACRSMVSISYPLSLAVLALFVTYLSEAGWFETNLLMAASFWDTTKR